MARSMMNEKNIPQTYWVEAIHTTIHILNKAHLRPHSDKPLMNFGLEDLLQSNILKFSEAHVISKTMMKILANMMTGLMKVSSWVMLQTVKGTDATTKDCIN
jgi:hypothetical protein